MEVGGRMGSGVPKSTWGEGMSGGSGRRGSWGRGGKTYILKGPAFGTFIIFLTGERSRPTPVRVATKSDHDILPGLHHDLFLV